MGTMTPAVAGARAGVARVDITPSWPVMLGGFGQRTTPSEGVLDIVEAKALWIANAHRQVLVITADLIAIPHQVSQPVVDAITAATTLTADQIVICASHSHSAPLPFGPAASGVSAYTELLIDRLVEVGLAARAAAVACTVGSGIGEIDVLFNRRTRGNPDVVDRRVPVLAVRAALDGRSLAVLFGVGCHPVTLGWENNLISADFPGVAQRAIEAVVGEGVAMFVNTTEANVIPVTSPNCDALDPRGYRHGSAADAETIGRTVADEVLRVLGEIETTSEVALGSVRRTLQLDSNNAAFDLPTAQARLDRADGVLTARLGDDFVDRANGHLWALASEHVVETDCSEEEMREVMIACCEHLGLTARIARGRALDPVDVPIQVLRIHDLELLALPGEPLVEVGREWSARANGDRAFVIGLANAHHRYLPLREHFELDDARRQYDTVTAGLEPSAVDRMLDEAASMLPLVR
ncbi:MAG: hypothetical protein NTZ21_08190 [Actinobacteria bacterium]|nr:hypothetical protein [Actinomycetota bacterium]